MKDKIPPITIILLLIVAVIMTGVITYYTMEQLTEEQSEENIASVFIYRFNGTIYIDNHGEGWLVYDNGTHILAKRIPSIEDWRVIG